MESREIRQQYKQMAEKVKQNLLAKHPDYQYKPRRPSERRRRIRRNPQMVISQDDAAQAGPSTDGAQTDDQAGPAAPQTV